MLKNSAKREIRLAPGRPTFLVTRALKLTRVLPRAFCRPHGTWPAPKPTSLEFPDGQIVLLTDLCEGQEATVLQLPAQPMTAAEAQEQERVAYVG